MFVDIERLAAMYRNAGLTVIIEAGAHTKAARQYATSGYPSGGPRLSDKHHTAQHVNTSDQSSINYLNGTNHPDKYVMANVYPHKESPYTLTIIAAGPTYTAGKGGPLGTVPQDRGNQYGWSWECPNNGVGEHWPLQLQQTMVIGAAVEMEFFGWRAVVERFPAHFEWTSRKIDPAGNSRYATGGNKWDMNAFRHDVEAKHLELYSEPEEPEVPPPVIGDDDVNYLWKHENHDGLFWFSNGSVVHIDAKLRDQLRMQGVWPIIESDNEEVFQSAAKASGFTPID
jgi:hypothetical protein